MSELVHVKGLEDLQKLLDILAPRIEKNIMRGALRAGANVIKKEAQNNVPVGPASKEGARLYGAYAGALRDSVRVSTKSKRGKVTATVKAGGKTKKGADVFYAHMVEYATSSHVIKSKPGKALKFGNVTVKEVAHPGTKSQPFMRPALDARAQDAVIAAGNYIKQRLSTKNGLDTSGITIEAGE